MTSRNPIDDTVDDVAHEMTAGDASANLRARVLADIETPHPFALWRPAFAAVAVAAAVMVAVVMRGTFSEAPGTLGNPPSTLPNQTSTLGNPPSTLPNQTSTQQTSTLGIQTRTLRVSPPTLRRLPGTVVNPFGEAPLEEESIAVDAIVVAPMVPTESIAVEELPSIAPIAVAPLGPGEQR